MQIVGFPVPQIMIEIVELNGGFLGAAENGGNHGGDQMCRHET